MKKPKYPVTVRRSIVSATASKTTVVPPESPVDVNEDGPGMTQEREAQLPAQIKTAPTSKKTKYSVTV